MPSMGNAHADGTKNKRNKNMKTEYTRAEYMAGNCMHDEFYAQFVTPSIFELVKSHIGEVKIKKSQDPNFNDIPLAHWDTLYSRILFCLDRKKFKRLSSPDAPAGVMDWSLSDSICIAKEAARQIVAKAEGRAEP